MSGDKYLFDVPLGTRWIGISGEVVERKETAYPVKVVKHIWRQRLDGKKQYRVTLTEVSP